MVISSPVGYAWHGALRHGRLGALSHHILSVIAHHVVSPAVRASFISPYQVPEYTAVATFGVVVGVVGIVASRRWADPTRAARHSRWWAAVTWYRHPPVLVTAAVLGMAATTVWIVHSMLVSPRGFVDLSVYRLGVQAWWQRADVYGVLPATGVGMVLPFTYPPFALLILGPLALPPWQWSIGGITVLSIACLALVIYITIRKGWPAGGIRGAVVGTAVLLPLSLLTEPVADTIWFGQVNLLLMALVALDCLAVSPRWPRGVLIGIAAAVKLTPAVFLLFFLLRKDYRALVTMAISGIVATAIGFIADWSGSFTFWLGSSGGAHAVGDSAVVLNQSLAGGIARLGMSGHAQTALWLTLVAVLLVFAVAGIRKALLAGSVPLAMVITAGFGLMASPISWGHHWVYVVPATILLVAEGIAHRRRGWLIVAAAVAVVFHVAAFLDVGTTWPPLSLLAENSFVLTSVALLAGYAGPNVWRAAARVARRVPVPVHVPAAEQPTPVTSDAG
ncbi:MAG TPA: glycosyltransferase 87 family protein [Pseudonocardiaceae bacterium]|nr:glycosyltransferase 87 family protein [Pseudonocardiaceae bacterium]